MSTGRQPWGEGRGLCKAPVVMHTTEFSQTLPLAGLGEISPKIPGSIHHFICPATRWHEAERMKNKQACSSDSDGARPLRAPGRSWPAQQGLLSGGRPSTLQRGPCACVLFPFCCYVIALQSGRFSYQSPRDGRP